MSGEGCAGGPSAEAGQPIGAVLQGVTLRNAYAETGSGGGVRVKGVAALLRECVIENNTAGSGGGVHAGDGALLRLENSTLRANRALRSGGGLAVEGTSTRAVVSGTLLRENHAGQLGGGGASVDVNARLVLDPR